jgi:hypothetical protein
MVIAPMYGLKMPAKYWDLVCENRWLSFEGIQSSECWRLGTDGSTISSLDD